MSRTDAELGGALHCLRNARRNAEYEGCPDLKEVQERIANVELDLHQIRVWLRGLRGEP